MNQINHIKHVIIKKCKYKLRKSRNMYSNDSFLNFKYRLFQIKGTLGYLIKY